MRIKKVVFTLLPKPQIHFVTRFLPTQVREEPEYPAEHFLISTALDQVELWENLDPRTKTNTQSCLLNTLRPLTGSSASRCFDVDIREKSNPAQAALSGKICIVSVQALTDPDLARFFFRVAKQEFFTAVQQRPGKNHQLCGVIADEFPLLVTPEDVEQLATVRSKRCFVIAATQGLDSLTQRLGTVASRAIQNHFNTVILMRTRESETGIFALLGLGNRLKTLNQKNDPGDDYGDTRNPFQDRVNQEETEVPICPLGALGRLAQHQAFIMYSDGRRTESAVWFVPWFEIEPTAPPPTAQDHCEYFYSAEHHVKLIAAAGIRQKISRDLVESAWHLQKQLHQHYLASATTFFQTHAAMIPRGLSDLPGAWLAALPGILLKTKKPHWSHIPYFIDRVKADRGMLLLHFAQEQPNPDGRLTSWDKIRIKVNASLYPSIWRDLSHRDKMIIGHFNSHMSSIIQPLQECSGRFSLGGIEV